MATIARQLPPRPPVFTSQQRHVMTELGAMVGSLDYHRQHCADLEGSLAVCSEGPLRHKLIRDLFAARRAEEAATLDLRDGVCHLTGLIRPSSTEAGI